MSKVINFFRATPMLDPRTWKRQHQVALIVSVGLGAALGLAFALHGRDFIPGDWRFGWSDPYGFWNFWFSPLVDCSRWGANWEFVSCSIDVSHYLRVALWTLFGATVGAALVYVRQLLRA